MPKDTITVCIGWNGVQRVSWVNGDGHCQTTIILSIDLLLFVKKQKYINTCFWGWADCSVNLNNLALIKENELNSPSRKIMAACLIKTKQSQV